MTNEEILNIVKLKYPEAKLSEDGKIIMGESGHYETINGVEKFVAEVLICIESNKIIFYHRKNDFFGYIIDCKSDVEYEFKNLIELKHILKLDITRDDIIDWLNTFLKEFNSFYTIPTKTFCEEYVYIKEKSLCLTVHIDEEDGDIFIATNPQEYWRLYNIINSLIEE